MASDVSTGPREASPALAPAAPAAPGQLRALAGDAGVLLTWSNGADRFQVTGHEITGSDGQVRTVGPDEVARVSGLQNGRACSFTVVAVNGAGSSPASAPSVPVTPGPASPPNRWLQSTPMPTARERSAAVRLRDGRVLVAGGDSGGFDPPPLTVCELYDPATSTWTAAEGIDAPQSGFALTLLADGRVLRTGGYTASFTPVAGAELFAPKTGTWTPALPMNTARGDLAAVLLDDGRVLVVGGSGAGPAALASAELYDPGTGTWAATGSLGTARLHHGAVRLLDGRVLVVGGDDGEHGLAGAELYDPATGTWSSTGAMSGPRTDAQTGDPGLALLPSGDVLVAGGSDAQGTVLGSAEVYRVATGTWQPTGDLVVRRVALFAFVALLDGRVLAAGGLDDFGPLPHAEVYDETTATWTPTDDDLRLARYAPAAALLADGRLLVVGGGVTVPAFGATASAETFSPG